jgi:hypothetical protein
MYDRIVTSAAHCFLMCNTRVYPSCSALHSLQALFDLRRCLLLRHLAMVVCLRLCMPPLPVQAMVAACRAYSHTHTPHTDVLLMM